MVGTMLRRLKQKSLPFFTLLWLSRCISAALEIVLAALSETGSLCTMFMSLLTNAPAV